MVVSACMHVFMHALYTSHVYYHTKLLNNVMGNWGGVVIFDNNG